MEEFTAETLKDRKDWIAITIRMPRDLIIELDGLATRWDYYRYEAMNELLIFALNRVERENYQPELFPE